MKKQARTRCVAPEFNGEAWFEEVLLTSPGKVAPISKLPSAPMIRKSATAPPGGLGEGNSAATTTPTKKTKKKKKKW